MYKITEDYDETPPFPLPEDTFLNGSHIKYIDSLEEVNVSKKELKETGWNRVRQEIGPKAEKPKKSNKKWAKIIKRAKTLPEKIKISLGIDDSESNRALNKDTPLNLNKTLVNWNERTFRIISNNLIFGGKLKENELKRYIDNLDENITSEVGPFVFYKKTGQIEIPSSQNDDLTDIALKGIKKALSIEDLNEKKEQLNEAKIEEANANPMLLRTYIREETNETEDEEENLDGPCDAITHSCSGKRKLGVGFCGRLLDNKLDSNKKRKFKDILTLIRQHRAFFTYWLTLAQIIICIVSLIAYGFAPFGISYTVKKGLATTINLEKQIISYPVKENFWLGPAVMDLVHLGAKYAPCIRNDSNIFKAIERDRLIEKETACCIRNDRGGCVQTSTQKCSELTSKWHKWNTSADNSLKRNSGSVCGLDPDFCVDIDANKWPDDITQWPTCEKPTSIFNSSVSENEHMFCEIIGRPCCVGVQGECLITTLEHCNLMRGYFHQEAHLCSQVDCMQDVCGMIDFLNAKSPDQIYRFFTSIFIHAGIIQLFGTIIFNMFVLRDVEKLAGWRRVSIIYILSGIIGNLGSAIFLPYQAEVGPMGSQFGIIACLFVELYHAWKIYEKPFKAFFRLFLCVLFLLAIGFLPMIDNFANVFGFISGLLLGIILFPNFNLNGKCGRVFLIIASSIIFLILVSVLVILFYFRPIESCDWCKKLSCPFSKEYCLEMDFNITRFYQII